MAIIDSISVFATAPAGASAPDSITVGNGSVWVAYTNGADSTGLQGGSTVVQYSVSGAVQHVYTLSGYVDGLKVDPTTGIIWALQNQDGNSTLSLINPVTNTVTGPLYYAAPSSTSGYDDVVFKGSQVFLSYTNPPGNPTDPTIVQLNQGNNPSGLLSVTPILTYGATGTNTETGATNQPVPQNDPDSIKLAPNGDILFSSGADGTLIEVHNPATKAQTVSFTPIAGESALDDVIAPPAAQGIFYVADTGNNRVLAIQVHGLNLSDVYASLGTLGSFAELNLATGVTTPLVSAADAPGGVFSSPHGAEFAASTTVVSPGGQQLTGASGPETVFAGGSLGDTVTGGSQLTFINGNAASKVSTSTGTLTVFAGAGGGTYTAGSAGNSILVGGAGAVTLTGGGSGDQLYAGGAGSNTLIAGAGNETLSAAGATGKNLLIGGTGNDLLATDAGANTVVGGSGADTIVSGSGSADIFAGSGNSVIVAGTGGDYIQAGTGNAAIFDGTGPDLIGVGQGNIPRDITISGFKVGTDHVTLTGYPSALTTAALQNATVSGGSTVIVLGSDNTQITFVGVTGLTGSSFV